jgi:hypothetical protein
MRNLSTKGICHLYRMTKMCIKKTYVVRQGSHQTINTSKIGFLVPQCEDDILPYETLLTTILIYCREYGQCLFATRRFPQSSFSSFVLFYYSMYIPRFYNVHYKETYPRSNDICICKNKISPHYCHKKCFVKKLRLNF